MAKNSIKVAPNSKESEMMVLGCMLTSVNSLNIAADTLDENDFYYTEHQILFQTLKTSYKQNKPADIHIVCEELKRQNKLDAIGGTAYVTTLAQYAGTSAYIEEYAEIVKSKAILRRMIQAAQVVEKNALEEPADVHEALDEAQGLFFKISQTANPGSGILITDLLSGVKASTQLPYLQEIQDRQEEFRLRGPQEAKITGIPTHYLDLDKLINGLNNSNLMIVAGRPAMGKTALAINIAENICFKNKMPVGIFSLEMTAEQLLHRIICSQAEVESDKIRTGNLTGADFQRIVSTVGEMQKQTMVIDDQPGLKITDLRARARRMKESYGIRLLVIDYLQLISGSGTARNFENRQNEISEISRMLKTLARELNIPVICASQLSRKVEDRAGHRPMMSDLRESGCLAGDTQIQDADTGKIYTIRELAERENQTVISVHAVDEKLKIGKHRMLKAFYSGKKTVYQLKTRSGRSIKASANHPFLKLEGWTRLDKLQKGDRIGLPSSLVINKSVNQKSLDELAFLAHLLGDGCILPKQPYHYTSQDEENLNCVGTLANSLFGIFPRFVKQKNWTHVYFPSPYPLTRGKYHPITNLRQIKTNPNNDVIPKQAWKYFVEPAKAKKGWGWREVCAGIETSYCGSTLFKAGISRERMQKLHSLLGDQKLLELAESNIYWDEISSIIEIGIEDVYDATVEGVHNFVANDILVHNSIEQDADIVIFLLRREYYDPNDKPGMAEIIVGKNRHGGVGSVNMTFVKELVQFRNYTPIQMESYHDSFADL